MFKSINSIMPSKKKCFFYYGFISLFLSVFVFMLGLYAYQLKDLENRAESAKNALTYRMNDIFLELKHIVDNSELSCEKEDIDRLRRMTFYSPTFKEFGLFNDNFRVYCTTYGPRDFAIFSSIVNRIKESSERKTVSLVRSHSLGESTFFAFYQGADGLGINGLAPSQVLAVDVDYLLSPDLPYELTIGKQTVVSSEYNHKSSVLAKRVESLDGWAISLVVFSPFSLYWGHLVSLLPFMFIFCLLCCLIFYTAHGGILYYRYSLPLNIKRAIKDNSIDVHFQPIVSLKAGGFHEMEALIRWHSPYHGQVSPLVIVETSERLGLIDDLTWMVIRKVGDFYREYPIQLKEINISVNVDRYSLLKESFAPNLEGIIAEYPELKGRLGLEVTETSALTVTELPLMVSRFEHIKALGIRLSVDDFGTGYAGLDFLRRFPYDTLKLDKVFIDSLKDDQFTRQILTSITKLAKELNMALVAEGVEREDQLDAVRALGVDRVQGYYFCRPLPKDQVITWVEKNATK
ncbi:EAL domain-containing protein [Marinomonas sp. RSW2]|uniref:cyclic-guanylate-specific phosphodiesterase n=1 Tax=Marinomonas maritima TaxID=2940935 RepID=A0ABT5WHJ8_9GAMM|nr:EAL domain-containing protein [Marinomonas maritima]MDE8604299.1 EAL domain-containing protein [Marinomonas maritima]